MKPNAKERWLVCSSYIEEMGLSYRVFDPKTFFHMILNQDQEHIIIKEFKVKDDAIEFANNLEKF